MSEQTQMRRPWRWGGMDRSAPPLLQPNFMELVITKERMRCDRHALVFSLLVLQFKRSRAVASKELKTLNKIFNKRLRLTDERGFLAKGGIGILLPMTEECGARVVLNTILKSAVVNGLGLEGEVFTYSGQDSLGHIKQPDFDGSESDAEILFDEGCSIDNVVDDSCGETFTGKPSLNEPAGLNQFVRADNESQPRTRGMTRIVPTSTVVSDQMCPGYPVWKRAMDIGCALLGLALAWPIILLAAIGIKLTSKGPVFFRQMRSGQFGNAFPMYKLRSMVVGAEELKEKFQQLNERDGPAFKIKNDPRVTRLGRFLRKTGFDELPQLWNVLVGHMAIVGPRPLPCNEDARCKLWQRRRLDTKPGLTCFWQIAKSRKVSFADWMRMDLKYADNRTFFGDLHLMLKTVLAVVLGRVGH